MATSINHISLAKTLPPKLLRFFARYPPSSTNSLRLNSTTPNITSTEIDQLPLDTESTAIPPELREGNPFFPQKHPVTGNWHDPIYSLRRQAELMKLAKRHGVQELLPFSTKAPDVRAQKREELGLRVKGTGVGQKVKGHYHERTMKGKLHARKQAMEQMPQMVDKWKQVST